MGELPALDRDPLREPSPDRLPPDAPGYDRILRAHAQAQAAGQQGYADPDTGYFVMTAAALIGRGDCCGCGCRHCPYVD